VCVCVFGGGGVERMKEGASAIGGKSTTLPVWPASELVSMSDMQAVGQSVSPSVSQLISQTCRQAVSMSDMQAGSQSVSHAGSHAGSL
jgi:hypothetical protein